MDNTKSAESAYDLTMQISDTISQLGVSGDPLELQQRLTELNRQQIENVKKSMLSGSRVRPPKDVPMISVQDEEESQVFIQQKSLLQRIFNRH